MNTGIRVREEIYTQIEMIWWAEESQILLDWNTTSRHHIVEKQ